jgi:hypothetical protein
LISQSRRLGDVYKRQKQKDYFTNKNIEYTFVDCSTPGTCPNFVHGFPTLVKDGKVMPGYQEL